MSRIVGKGNEARERLMSEVEALFIMNSEKRKEVESAAVVVTQDGHADNTYERFVRLAGLTAKDIAGQPLESANYTDGDGNPDGGYVEGPGLAIRWQRGPIDPDEEPWNGCFLVTVLEAAKRQLEFYQSGKFKCERNENALDHVNMAIEILNNRQFERFVQGVRGVNEV